MAFINLITGALTVIYRHFLKNANNFYLGSCMRMKMEYIFKLHNMKPSKREDVSRILFELDCESEEKRERQQREGKQDEQIDS